MVRGTVDGRIPEDTVCKDSSELDGVGTQRRPEETILLGRCADAFMAGQFMRQSSAVCGVPWGGSGPGRDHPAGEPGRTMHAQAGPDTVHSMPANPPEAPASLSRLRESDRFVSARVGRTLVVVWTQVPTVPAVDEVLGEFIEDAKVSPGVGYLLVALPQEPVPNEAQQHSVHLARTHGKLLAALAVVEGGTGFLSRINRIALRAIMATAGAAGQGPASTGFFATVEEAVPWMARTLLHAGQPADEAALATATAWLVQRGREQMARRKG